MSTTLKPTLLIAVPVAFIAGIAAMALLVSTGVISVNQTQNGSILKNTGSNANIAVGSAANQSKAAQLASVAELNQRIDELEQILQASTKQSDLANAQFDKNMEALRRQFEQNIASLDASLSNKNDSTVAAVQSEQNGGGRRGRANRFGPPDAEEQYNNLLLAGVDPYVAQEIQQRNDQWALARLELVDQAAREGWRDSEQFSERMEALRDTRPDIRAELGDDDYDRYLYAAGDSNRVAVSSIINGSAAQQAGMQNGDVVISYANSRVFGRRELQSATRDGQRGESVQVEVLRNGNVITVDVPRGPLGVSLTGSRAAPAE